jgi:glutamate-1-semialdehyde 2,1-aminomutase
MAHLAPLGPVYQAGTLSGNPIAMTAGATTLAILQRDSVWSKLDDLGARLERAMTPVLAQSPVPVGQVRLGSLAWFYFQPGAAPRSAAAVDSASGARFAPVFRALLQRGFYVAPSAYEVLFLSTAHTPADIDHFAAAFAAALGEASETRP